MTTKEYLNRAYYIDKRITSKLEVLDKLNALAMKSTPTLSDMPSSPTRNVHKREQTIAKIIDLEKEINAQIDELVDLKREIYQVINEIDDIQCTLLLEQRYICFHKWEEIAVLMDCDVRTVYRIHGEALKKVEKIL